MLGYRVEVSEPLQKLRIVLEETEGIAVDLTWNGLFDVIQEQRHVLRTGTRVTLDAQRFAQVGSWSGVIAIDGEEITVDPDVWIGSRDRSWGIRPIGEPEPAGRPAHPPFEGMWWLYVPMAFDDFAICLIIQEEPNGFRSLNDVTRIWRDGRVEQMGWPRVKSTTPRAPAFRPARPSRRPRGTVRPSTSTWSPSCRCRFTSAAATAATPTGLHGMWKGDKFTERLTYDMTDPAIVGAQASASSTTSAAPSAPRAASPSKAGACSSTVRSGGTTRPDSPTG